MHPWGIASALSLPLEESNMYPFSFCKGRDVASVHQQLHCDYPGNTWQPVNEEQLLQSTPSRQGACKDSGLRQWHDISASLTSNFTEQQPFDNQERTPVENESARHEIKKDTRVWVNILWPVNEQSRLYWDVHLLHLDSYPQESPHYFQQTSHFFLWSLWNYHLSCSIGFQFPCEHIPCANDHQLYNCIPLWSSQRTGQSSPMIHPQALKLFLSVSSAPIFVWLYNILYNYIIYMIIISTIDLHVHTHIIYITIIYIIYIV